MISGFPGVSRRARERSRTDRRRAGQRSRALPPGEEVRVRRQAGGEGRDILLPRDQLHDRQILQLPVESGDGRHPAMNFFQYQGSELRAEGVALAKIGDEVGTPCYVYSLATLRRHYRVFDEAFAAAPHVVCYSVKANSNLAVLAAFAREGSGFDIVSGGELYRALAAGADPRKIVFSGIGKTRDEMAYAL